MSRTIRWGTLALVALAMSIGQAHAHIVPVGVGSQTELRLTPRRLRVHYNLGFSSVLGLAELKLMDLDRSGSIDRAEQEAYLDRLGEQLIPGLKLTLDGQPQELVLLARRGLGILGPIEQVAFDTWFELEVRCDLGPGPHTLVFHEGNFEGQTAEQLLWVPLDRLEDFARLETIQERAPGPAVEQQGVRRLLGRDLRIDFEFTPAALERDRAAAAIEPSLAGVDRAVGAVRTGLIEDVESELAALAFREVQLGAGDTGARLSGAAPPMVAQMARDRVVDADSGAAVRSPEPGPAAGTAGDASSLTTAPDAARMIDALNQPFSWAILVLFFGWGAAHALLPGHGKTMVAAYLLGTRGRIADALRLGGIVTFTHTFALYTAGLALVWVIERYGSAQGQTFHEKLVRHVSLLSGLGLITYGAWLAWSRMTAIRGAGHQHGHAHDHGHEHVHADGTRHSHPHSHAHGAAHGHGHGHVEHDHEHGHGHEHVHADGTRHSHPHEHGHSHDPAHEHDHAHEHGHDHAHGHEHDHPHDHAHEHGHDHAHEHGHDHAHDHDHGHGHGHGHAHSHDHGHGHAHSHDHGHGHAHSHGHGHHHDHGALTDEEHARLHASEAAQITSWRDLLVLGVTGGIVPCPAGVTLVLYSLTFKTDNTKKAFVYLSSFSLGLGSVLVAIATAMVLSKSYLFRGREAAIARSRALLWLPVGTACLISLVGVGVCWEAFDPGYARLKAALGLGV